MGKAWWRLVSAVVVACSMVFAGATPGAARGIVPGSGGDEPILRQGVDSLAPENEDAARLLALDDAFVAAHTAGDTPLSIDQAGELRSTAADAKKKITPAPAGSRFKSPWTGLGPNPIRQFAGSSGTLQARSGRIGALAIRPNGQWILGAAQGGIWLYDKNTNLWVAKTDQLPSLAIGALAVANSPNDSIVYAGTGEGALSGDSYFGNGILKSTDGGNTWAHVSGDFFAGVSTARLAVDPNNANHLFAAIERGRGGTRRVSPPIHSTYGIWESTDGAVSWKLKLAAPGASLGATDVRLDPQNVSNVYASFWSDKIYKSSDGGATWHPIINGFPADADFAANSTRFAIGISHPSGKPAVLYTGFDYNDTAGVHHAARVWRSDDQGATWVRLPATTDVGTVAGYCGGQCFYDNVIESDPADSNTVYAAGQVSGALGAGAIYRSDDGGQTWKNMSWDLHADMHALAFNPANTANILLGNDGGVWYSPDRGGRNHGETVDQADWVNLNGHGLQITQFTSVATVPQVAPGLNSERFWGGTQDNGTERKSVNSQSWFDVAGGDGGQVLVDQTDQTVCAPLFSKGCYVYGTYFGISPYRITDGGGSFFSNQFIVNGINLSDRSEFYTPFVLNQLNTNQLLLGTYRLYRTDNAKTELAGDVQWAPISPDLTSGCPGPAPNGARNCTISAIGVGGGTAVYTGSNDGFVFMSPDGLVSGNPTWVRLGNSGENGNGDGDHSDVWLPQRPVASIAVDRSNYRVAYITYDGFSAATPKRPGHIFKTTNGGQSFTNITSNLPDTPVNSILIDPAFPNTLYIGTDIGPFVSFNGGRKWYQLGSGFPIVAIDQIDMDPYHRMMIAGTHGRGAFRIQDSQAAVPALVIEKHDAGVPVGPGSKLDYTVTVHNIGNAAATGVSVSDPVPAHTSFVSADGGGSLTGGGEGGGVVRWTGQSVASGGSIDLHFSVRIDLALDAEVTSIVNDGFRATDAQGQRVHGSPTVTKIAPKFGVSISPAAQSGGSQAGGSQTYIETVKNLGYKTDSFNLTASAGPFGVSFLNSTCTSAMSTPPALIAGATVDVCVKVSVPGGTPDGTKVTSTVTATSVGNPAVSASAVITTIAVTKETLLVKEDGDAPDTSAFYKAALGTAGIGFNTWDLGANPVLPIKYMEAYKHVVWFTGNSFPGPIQPYERSLAAYLNNGGHLFISGQDLLDQAAGTTKFVQNYLHVTWDGTETQNDKPTAAVHEVAGTLSAGVGTVPLDANVLGNQFMDQITPNGGATAILTDDAGQPDALSFKGTYRVVFLAFGFEEYGTAAQKADFVARVFNFFNS